MVMSRITVHAGKTIAGLATFARRLDDPSPALKRCGRYLVEVTKERFRKGVGPGNRPWKRLSEPYAAWKRKHGYSSTPLTRTGLMRRSIHWIITGKRSIAIGSTLERLGYHQDGRGRNPKREVLGVDDSDARETQAIFRRWILEGKS